ncbi:MAG TPA: hypothetical protein DCM48_26765 [Thalassospira sp.]|nr:hypothetical protein [Thalassospira sp.]
MGVLIVVGIGLVVYGLSLDKNASDTSVEENTPTVTPSVPFAGGDNAAAQGALGAFGDVVIDLEDGERLVGYSVDGSQATLHIEGRNGDRARIVIVSLSEKKVLGRILLQQAAQ